MQNQIPFEDLTSNSHHLTIVRLLIYRVAQFSEKTNNDQFGNWLSFYTFRITQPYILWKQMPDVSNNDEIGWCDLNEKKVT